MRKILVTLAAASALSVAAPAHAQAYGAPRYGYRHDDTREHVARLQDEIARVQQQVWRVQGQGLLRGNEGRWMIQEAQSLNDRVRGTSYRPISSYELRQLQARTTRLAQQVHYAAKRGEYSGRDDRYDRRQHDYDHRRDGRDNDN
jgi:hypothetical protein